MSLIHEIWEFSTSRSHTNLLFENIKEVPGQRISVNMLTRDRLCEAIGIQPEVYIDTLAWAMKNPSTPELVSPADSPVFDHMQEEVDLHSIAIPYHWPQDRGRYMSASVIIAEVNGQRNMSFHRQFLRDKNHLVVNHGRPGT
jgi:2,5-furandicarboxylate decarboxylase 1